MRDCSIGWVHSTYFYCKTHPPSNWWYYKLVKWNQMIPPSLKERLLYWKEVTTLKFCFSINLFIYFQLSILGYYMDEWALGAAPNELVTLLVFKARSFFVYIFPGYGGAQGADAVHLLLGRIAKPRRYYNKIWEYVGTKLLSNPNKASLPTHTYIWRLQSDWQRRLLLLTNL